jgi:hypothetical protein
MEGIHVEWHVVKLAMEVRKRRIDEWIGFAVLVDEFPSGNVRGMENMRTINVDGDAIHIFGGAVATDFVSFFDDENFFAGLS